MAFTKGKPGKRLLTALIGTVIFVAGGIYPVGKYLPSGHHLRQELTFLNAPNAEPEKWNEFLNYQKNTLLELAQRSTPPLNNYFNVKTNSAPHQLTLNLRYPSNQDLTDPFRKLIENYKNTFSQSQKKIASQNLLDTTEPKSSPPAADLSGFDQEIRTVMHDFLDQQLEDQKRLEEDFKKIELKYTQLSAKTVAMEHRLDNSNFDEHADFSGLIKSILDHNIQADSLLPQLQLDLNQGIEQIRTMDYQASKTKSHEDLEDIDRQRDLLHQQLVGLENEIAQRKQDIAEEIRKRYWPIYLMGLKSRIENNHQQLEIHDSLKKIKATSLQRVKINIAETRAELEKGATESLAVSRSPDPIKSIFRPTLKLPLSDIDPRKTPGTLQLLALAVMAMTGFAVGWIVASPAAKPVILEDQWLTVNQAEPQTPTSLRVTQSVARQSPLGPPTVDQRFGPTDDLSSADHLELLQTVSHTTDDLPSPVSVTLPPSPPHLQTPQYEELVTPPDTPPPPQNEPVPPPVTEPDPTPTAKPPAPDEQPSPCVFDPDAPPGSLHQCEPYANIIEQLRENISCPLILISALHASDASPRFVADLAIVLQRRQIRVLLIEADQESSVLAEQVFEFPASPGFYEWRRGDAWVAQVTLETHLRNLTFMPAGIADQNQSDANIDLTREAHRWANLRNKFDVILFYCPCALIAKPKKPHHVAAAQLLHLTDGLFAVTRTKNPAPVEHKIAATLSNCKTRLLALISIKK